MTALLTIGAISCVLCLVLWVWFLAIRVRRGNLLVQDHQTVVPWGLLDVYMVFLVFVMIVPTAIQYVSINPPRSLEVVEVDGEEKTVVKIASLEPDEKAFNNFVGAAIRVFAIALIILYFAFRHQATADELGFSLSDLPRKIGMGVVGGFMFIPPAIGMIALLSLWWKYSHPTLNKLSEGSTPASIAAVILAIGIVTPILEELLFRGVIQGCLQRLAQIKNIDYWGAVLGGRVESTEAELNHENSSAANIQSAPLWPIFVSAAIFAAMHLGLGPSPIPLYFLALGLGYLYWKTHSLIPCIIIHTMLNTWSLLLKAAST